MFTKNLHSVSSQQTLVQNGLRECCKIGEYSVPPIDIRSINTVEMPTFDLQLILVGVCCILKEMSFLTYKLFLYSGSNGIGVSQTVVIGQ